MERMNLWVEQYLRHWVTQQGQNNWVTFLPTAEFVHNSWPHDVTKKTPHKLMFSIKPHVHVEAEGEGNAPQAIDRLLTLQQARLIAAEALLHHYKTKTPIRQFTEGERVWLSGRNLPLPHPSRKLAPKRFGPFPITHKISPVAYRLALPNTMRIHDVFHTDLLTPFVETEAYGPAFTPLPPDLVEGQEEQEIEAILDVR